MRPRIKRLSVVCTAALLLLTDCEKPAEKTSPTAEPQPAIPNLDSRQVIQIESDSCGFITREEVAEAQGAAVQETRGGGSTNGRVQALQCYYATVDPNRSVSVVVMKDDPAALGQNGAKMAWNRIFGRYNDDGEELEENEEEEEFEERPKMPVRRVEGIGEKAFWVGSQVGASLHVLKGNAYVRVTVSGPDNDEIQLARSKTLALKALDRL